MALKAPDTRQNGTMIPERWGQVRRALDVPQLTALREFPDCDMRSGTRWSPWIPWVRVWGGQAASNMTQSVREEGAAQRTRVS